MPLRDFLRVPANSVSRERIFFHQLYFDMKIAAARRDYALTLFEPEVDRDGYDVVLDDGDNQRHLQLKTVLKSSTTHSWNSSKRFLRPALIYGGRLNWAPADCGLGGGFILIEVDDSDDQGRVRYFYSDYFLVFALYMRLFLESTNRQRDRRSRYTYADDFLGAVKRGSPREVITLPRQLFFRVKSADCLLATAGLHSAEKCYLPADDILQAYDERFVASANGIPEQGVTSSAIGIAQAHAANIFSLFDEPALRVFTGNIKPP